MPQSLTVLAPAKLNLALAVGAPDVARGGLHPLCSWMVTVDLHDELQFVQLEPGRLSRYAILWHKDARRRSEINWSLTKDLAVRAHLTLQQRVQRDLPVQMKLEKRIPVGAGLGGGSSNAAAMLRGVNELFNLGLTIEELAAIGATLGSDVPFLVHSGSAVVRGLGERIERHDTPPPLHAVIAFPEAQCSTGRVYALFDELQAGGRGEARGHDVDVLVAAHVRAGSQTPSAAALNAALFNDLAPAALRAAAALGDDLAALAALAERPAHVTGSGSSLFVLCDDQLHAEALAAAVESKLGLPALAVRTTSHEPSRQASAARQ